MEDLVEVMVDRKVLDSFKDRIMAHPIRRGVLFNPEKPEIRVEVEFTNERFDVPSANRNRIGTGRINTPAERWRNLVGQPLLLQADDGEELRIDLQSNGEFYRVIEWEQAK